MYSTGAYTDAVDLVNSLATFIEANGWTRDSLATEGSGRRYHAHRGSIYLNLRALVNESAASSSVLQDGSGTNIYGVSFNIGTGYSGGSNWYNQAGTPQNSSSRYRTVGVNNINTSGTYHFFAHNSGDQIMVILEYASGFYQRFYFGTLVKYGTWTGGPYMGASNNGLSNVTDSPAFGFFRGSHGGNELLSGMNDVYALLNVDVDAESGWHWNIKAAYGGTRRSLKDLNNVWSFAAQGSVLPNTLNNLAVFFPVVAFVNRSTIDAVSTSTTPLGEIPYVFYTTLANFVPGQQITLGSDNYRVFPFLKKNSIQALPSAAGSGHSGWYGFAIKE